MKKFKFFLDPNLSPLKTHWSTAFYNVLDPEKNVKVFLLFYIQRPKSLALQLIMDSNELSKWKEKEDY